MRNLTIYSIVIILSVFTLGGCVSSNDFGQKDETGATSLGFFNVGGQDEGKLIAELTNDYEDDGIAVSQNFVDSGQARLPLHAEWDESSKEYASLVAEVDAATSNTDRKVKLFELTTVHIKLLSRRLTKAYSQGSRLHNAASARMGREKTRREKLMNELSMLGYRFEQVVPQQVPVTPSADNTARSSSNVADGVSLDDVDKGLHDAERVSRFGSSLGTSRSGLSTARDGINLIRRR
ncbi:MAG: hypothetical protein H6619_03790 [Deltaproteobacteria bacterium]|nr:hypothetical protein [Deltaproteobacteria bacterium]